MVLKERAYEATDEEQQIEIIAEAIEQLVDCSNGLGTKVLAPAIARGIMNSHRYLQGEFINCLMSGLGIVTRVGGTDARNESQIETLKKALGALESFDGNDGIRRYY